MSLSLRLADDLKTAMRAKDERTLTVLRMLKAAVANWELAQAKSASEDDILKLIGTQVKQRKDAAAQYRDGGRPELAESEDAEAVILLAYLPEQMSEDEVHAVVVATAAEIGATDPQDLGKLMGALKAKVAGRADGATLSRLAKAALGG